VNAVYIAELLNEYSNSTSSIQNKRKEVNDYMCQITENKTALYTYTISKAVKKQTE